MSDFRRDAELDAALEKINLENYLDREGVGYRHSYGTKGLQLQFDECPFCGEGGGKTYCNADTGLGNCFHGSCGAKFNKFTLIRKVSGLAGPAFAEHVKAVAQEMGWMPKKERAEIVMGELKLPNHLDWLPHNGRELRYLAERGVTAASCEWFRLGYCHDKAWWRYLLDDGTEKFMNFSRRVIIPIFDLDGTMVSFQGRDVTGAQLPKYQFPNGYAVAGKHIYNGNGFTDGVHTHLVIGEGAFDGIAVHQAIQTEPGCRDMLGVATFGMHLSGGPDSQLDRLVRLRERGLRTVTFLWDGEGRAIAQAVKSGLQVAGLGLQVRIATLPEGYDPAQGPDKLPTPPAMVLEAIFKAQVLNRLSAVRILSGAKSMSV
jgi:DNA primase